MPNQAEVNARQAKANAHTKLPTIKELIAQGYKVKIKHVRPIVPGQRVENSNIPRTVPQHAKATGMPKEDVRDGVKIGFVKNVSLKPIPISVRYHFTAVFAPAGGYTEAEITTPDGKVYTGRTICSKKDTYCRKTGAMKAVARAMAPVKRPPERDCKKHCSVCSITKNLMAI